MDWAGPGRWGRNFSWAGPGRSGPKFLRAGPGRFLRIFREDFANIRHFLNEQYLILNELLIKFKFSLKNLLKILIEIKLSMTGPRFQLGRAGPLRPKIFAGRAVAARDFSWAVPARPKDLQPCWWVVSRNTAGRKIDFVASCIAESITIFSFFNLKLSIMPFLQLQSKSKILKTTPCLDSRRKFSFCSLSENSQSNNGIHRDHPPA